MWWLPSFRRPLKSYRGNTDKKTHKTCQGRLSSILYLASILKETPLAQVMVVRCPFVYDTTE